MALHVIYQDIRVFHNKQMCQICQISQIYNVIFGNHHNLNFTGKGYFR